MKTIICDLDGTLARDDHRNHHIQKPKGERQWDAYFAACEDDAVNVPVAHLLRHLCHSHYIIILTARVDTVKPHTLRWLAKHGIPYNLLIMRPAKNRTDDNLWKIKQAEPYKNDVVFILEDRQRVVDAWRENGYSCFQVAPGDF